MLTQTTSHAQAPARHFMCPSCGATKDLIARSYHVGGHGYRTVIECRDKIGCFRRQDIAIMRELFARCERKEA